MLYTTVRLYRLDAILTLLLVISDSPSVVFLFRQLLLAGLEIVQVFPQMFTLQIGYAMMGSLFGSLSLFFTISV